ncbi:hypothetical protein [Brachybacterium saurashtrense]|uniref:Uncharacterized protein n=1 Tax=Brachybacterium saurashtrense TaxID=556288 RepID=A0A345YJV5_9MICO|nr:hypothetical protein [Brachybacterium saurashtrense]AXK44207.1 hypothetical protein DWV08_00240 [Brachybacterium saurashtrense]RRR21479.1 hypothetical protein DXU92_14140 [Brachybacterium saurashtrense]
MSDPQPAPGDLSVVFSAAPPPAEDAASLAPEQSGAPWFLPEDGPRPDDLASAVDVDADPVGAAATLAQIPVVRGAVELLAHVGEGREAGEVDVLDEHVGPWNALVAGRWLSRDGERIVPGEGMMPVADEAGDPAGFVRFARALLVLLVLEGLRQGPEEGGLFGGTETFTAMLCTVVPGGLLLPATISVALERGLVPDDLAGDPDMDEISRYWQTEHDLATLAAYGLLQRETSPGGEDIRYRGTPEVLVEAFAALEMSQELD